MMQVRAYLTTVAVANFVWLQTGSTQANSSVGSLKGSLTNRFLQSSKRTGQCTDNPDNWMKSKGFTCADWKWGVAECNRCNNNDNWKRNKYCQLSCSNAGCGYDGDLCSCTNEPDPYMIKQGFTCEDWVWGVASCNRCNNIDNWKNNKFCQQSCYDAGCGYVGDTCPANAPAPTIAPAPSVPEWEADVKGKATMQQIMPNVVDASSQISKCPHWKSQGDYETLLDAPGNGVVNLKAMRYLVKGNLNLGERSLVIPVGATVIINPYATITAGEIVVRGSLHAGSSSCPIMPVGGRPTNINIVLTGRRPGPTEDTSGISHKFGRKGIVIERGGLLAVYGWRPLRTWTRLAQTAMEGSQTLSLQQLVDWNVGDWIVVVTTVWMDSKAQNQNEKHQIASVSGRLVTLQSKLRYSHYGGVEYQAEVALLTRAISVQGDDQSEKDEYGGHLICMPGSTCNVQGIRAYRMGQKNAMARYPLHFHKMGDVRYGSWFRDCVIEHSYFRAITIHATNNAIVERNVAFDITGSAFYLEDGVEIGNKLLYNLVAHVHVITKKNRGDGKPHLENGYLPRGFHGQQGVRDIESDHDLLVASDVAAAGFYCTNVNNTWIGNSASGGFSGFIFPQLPYALGESWADNQDYEPLSQPFGTFDSNTAHSSGTQWSSNGACVYVGGALVNDPLGSTRYVYTYGRALGDPYRHSQTGRTFGGRKVPERVMDVLPKNQYSLTNLKVAVCKLGYLFWGAKATTPEPFSLNNRFEAHDVFKAAHLMGVSSINFGIFTGHTDNYKTIGDFSGQELIPYSHLFEQYDLGMATALSNIHFRGVYKQATSPRIPGDICVKDVTRSSTINSLLTISGVTFDRSIPENLMFRHVSKDALQGRAGGVQKHCNVRNSLALSQFSPCGSTKAQCEATCPGTSYSSQIVAIEVPDDSLKALGSQFSDGALLGGADSAAETSGTNNWWQMDDTCVKKFEVKDWSGGFWVCPSHPRNRMVVNVLMFNVGKYEQQMRTQFPGARHGRLLGNDPAAPDQWAVFGTLYHFGRRDRRLELDKGLPQVAGPCCDVGWYFKARPKPLDVLAIHPMVMALSVGPQRLKGGLVFSTSYRKVAIVTLWKCEPTRRNGQLAKSCEEAPKAQSFEQLKAETATTTSFVETTDKSKRIFVKFINPTPNDYTQIGELSMLNRAQYSCWYEIRSSNSGSTWTDLPNGLQMDRLAAEVQTLQDFGKTTNATENLVRTAIASGAHDIPIRICLVTIALLYRVV